MCVIVLRNPGVELSEKDVSEMWEYNPDGAGAAWFEGRGWRIEKGLMSLKEVMEIVRAESLKCASLFLHFRMATHGLVNPHQTHPFIIDAEIDRAKGFPMHNYARAALFHNGIIGNFGDREISDTCDFVTSVLAHVPKDNRAALLREVGGKFALLQGATYTLIGHFIERFGLMVSNTNWVGGRRHTKGGTRYTGCGYSITTYTDRDKKDEHVQGSAPKQDASMSALDKLLPDDNDDYCENGFRGKDGKWHRWGEFYGHYE